MFDINEFLGITAEEKQTTSSPTAYLSFKNPGVYTIRVLEKFTPINTHYIQDQRVSVLCLGKDCPICAKNLQLFKKYDENAPKQKGFYSKQTRYVANVLDKTPSIFCLECGKQVHGFLYKEDMPCPSCKVPIPKQPFVIPEEVKLVSFSKTFIEQLKVIAMSVLDEEGNVVPLTHYDIKIISAIVSDRTQISPFPSEKIEPPPQISQEFLYPHEKIAIKFSKVELLDILEGVDYRDVLKARNTDNTTTIVGTTPVEMDNEIAEEAKSVVNTIKELFDED